MTTAASWRCGDCGQPAIGHRSATDLGEQGWKLLRLRDSYGNPVLWWRCRRCCGPTPDSSGAPSTKVAAH